MKLYATLKNERGGKKSTSDDTRIQVELTYKNKVVGTVGLYSVWDGKEELGYRVVWHDDGPFDPDRPPIKEEVRSIRVVPDSEHSKEYLECEALDNNLEEATAKRIQNFGEQHPRFHSKEMNAWRKREKQKVKATGDKVEPWYCKRCNTTHTTIKSSGKEIWICEIPF